jgi:hypothetical protein
MGSMPPRTRPTGRSVDEGGDQRMIRMDGTWWERRPPVGIPLNDRLLDSLGRTDDIVRPCHLAVPREAATGMSENHQMPGWPLNIGADLL